MWGLPVGKGMKKRRKSSEDQLVEAEMNWGNQGRGC